MNRECGVANSGVRPSYFGRLRVNAGVRPSSFVVVNAGVKPSYFVNA